MMSVGIYGTGGAGREIAWLAEVCEAAGSGLAPVCFVDDNPDLCGREANGLPIVDLEQFALQYPGAGVVMGIGCPAVRERLVARVQALGVPIVGLEHPQLARSRFVEIGTGVVICAGTTITTNVWIGGHVQINLDCTISHDVRIGDYTTLTNGVHVSGNVHIGKRVWLGVGAVILNGAPEQPLHIGDDAVIGAGACVTRPIAPGTTVVGVPARPLYVP